MLHIDGDALVYIAGFSADSQNGPFSYGANNLKRIVKKVLRHTGEKDFRIFLTSTDPKVNFRTEILETYKKNREKVCICGSKEFEKEGIISRFPNKAGFQKRRMFECLKCGEYKASTKPVYYNKLRKFLMEYFDAKICPWGEADDWLAIGLKSKDFIATHDKDLKMLPCRYYNLKTEEISEHSDPGMLYLDEKRKLKGYGFKWFCAQLLLGDATDNIIKVKKGDADVFFSKFMLPLETMTECWKMVEFYYKATGNEDKLWLMAELLWVARKKYQRFNSNVLLTILESEK